MQNITVAELSEKLKSDETFILLDVRELTELNYAKLTDDRLEVTPMSRLAAEGTTALSESAQEQDSTIYVLCHHGTRRTGLHHEDVDAVLLLRFQQPPRSEHSHLSRR